MTVWVEAYNQKGSRVFEVHHIQATGSQTLSHEKNIEYLTYALLKAAQLYHYKNPNTLSFHITLPRSENPDIVLMQRQLGFNDANPDFLHLTLLGRDIPRRVLRSQ